MVPLFLVWISMSSLFLLPNLTSRNLSPYFFWHECFLPRRIVRTPLYQPCARNAKWLQSVQFWFSWGIIFGERYIQNVTGNVKLRVLRVFVCVFVRLFRTPIVAWLVAVIILTGAILVFRYLVQPFFTHLRKGKTRRKSTRHCLLNLISSFTT